MKYVTLPEALFVLLFLFVACGFFGYAAITQPPWQPGQPIPLEIIVSPTLPAAAVALSSPVATVAAGALPVTGPTTIQVNTIGAFGPALVDSRGYSLYLYTGGEQYRRPEPCNNQEECLEDWTPFLTSDDPVAGQGADPNLLGTITRDDGTIQITYNGWPLYFLPSTDRAAGDTTGQADDNEWFLVSPAGTPIKSSAVQ